MLTIRDSIPELELHLQESLQMCHTQLERDCCRAIGGRGIRERAQALRKTRTLTNYERHIAEQYGYREDM
jgi:hypothetical protein